MKKINIELISTLFTFVLCFIAFNYFFAGTSEGSYFQNIILVLLGTILTIIITSMLLNKQSSNEQLKEQNVAVFKEKVDRYKRFTELLVHVMEDDMINKSEASNIKNEIYNLALFSSEETLDTIARFLRFHLIHDQEEKVSLFDVISSFRADLQLEGLEIFDNEDIAPISSLINNNFDQLNYYQLFSKYFKKTNKKIIDKINQEEDIIGCDLLEGNGNIIYSFLVMDSPSDIQFLLSLKYPKLSDKGEFSLTLEFNEDPEFVFNDKIEKMSQWLLDTNFNKETLDDNTGAGWLSFTKEFKVRFKYHGEKLHIEDTRQITNIVEEIISIKSYSDSLQKRTTRFKKLTPSKKENNKEKELCLS